MDGVDAIVDIVRETGALEGARRAAAAEAQGAIDCLALRPRNAYSEGLLQLASPLPDRRHLKAASGRSRRGPSKNRTPP